jgi:uncharacterized protein (DUF2147 family)
MEAEQFNDLPHSAHFPSLSDRMKTFEPFSSTFQSAVRCLRTLGIVIALLGVPTLAIGQTPKAAVPPAAVAPAPQPDVAGIWIDHTGQGAVEVYGCGAMVCGRVVWIKVPIDKMGRALMDGHNPDPAKRSKPMCGVQIIGNVARQPNGTWDNGWIYNPEDGGTFSVELQLRSADTLQVKGYAGLKFLSETFTWKRAPANLARCGTV